MCQQQPFTYGSLPPVDFYFAQSRDLPRKQPFLFAHVTAGAPALGECAYTENPAENGQ
jgi:hypothetical protein